MKTIGPIIGAIALVALLAGCASNEPPPPPPPPPPSAPPPPVVVQPPPPPAGVVVYTPDYYTWDGYEWVGVAGGQYVYWSGGAWIVCDPIILGRFHSWERYHPQWRGRAYYYRHGRYYR